MSKENDIIPVYLFTGFLESGKTKFIQETLEDRRFCKGEKTLLLVCEEGEEEYEPDNFADQCTYIRVFEDESNFTEEKLAQAIKETRAERVIIEYNGMWRLDTLYANMPKDWSVFQEFMFAEATTFLGYNSNMRTFVYDKLKSADLCVFNRFTDSMDKLEFHKIVRAASRRADIAYEYAGDRVEYDDIEDPLPFDINAPIIEIGDEDYAEWYRDLSDEPQKYDGKKVRFKGCCLQRKKVPAGNFIVGRHIMTCCEADIAFAPFICKWPGAKSIQDDSWRIITAEIKYKFSPVYGKKGPVLNYIESEICEPPKPEVAAFY